MILWNHKLTKRWSALIPLVLLCPSLLGKPVDCSIMVEEPASPDSHSTYEKAKPKNQWELEALDWSRDRVAEYIEGINDGLDGFFVETFFEDDQFTLEELSKSSGQLFFKSKRVVGESVDYQTGVNLKLTLPNTNERLKLLVETEEDDNDERESDVLGTADNVTYTTGLRILIKETNLWRTAWDNSVRWEGEPVPFTRLRARRIHYLQLWRTRFYQSLSYQTNDGWGEKTRFTATRPISIGYRFQFGFNASYYLNEDYFNLSSSLSLSQDISEKAIMVYRMSVSGDTEGIEKVTSYTVAAGYRRELYKNFVYLDLVPEVSWPRSGNFEPTPAISFKLEMLFGHD